MAAVYILYSQNIDSYYIGSCKELHERMEEHISKKYSNSFTAKTDDWKVIFSIDDLQYSQARNIESHIKRMKSRIYIENLCKYSEIVQKLKIKYQ